MPQYILAIDVGTSSTRAALIDENLTVVALGSEQSELITVDEGGVEQHPRALLQSVVTAVQRCFERAPANTVPAAVILDTAMHSLVALDPEGEPLSPLYIWADTRARQEADIIAASPQGPALYERTGCPVHASFWPAKLRWLQNHDPDTFARAHTFASVKGYLLFALTEQTSASKTVVEDLSSASATGLLNMHTRDWDEEALHIAGLRRHDQRLPRVVEPRRSVGNAAPIIARYWSSEGEARRVPVLAGGTDGPLANVGAGAVEPGDMVITVGTSAAVRMITDAPRVDRDARTWCYYVADDVWAVGGALNSGGTSVDWIVRAFPEVFHDLHLDRAAARQAQHRRIEEMLQQTPPGADGLLFAPYFTGERSPGWNEHMRGFMLGAGMQHTAAHFVRAIMEGVAFQIASVVESVADVAGTPKEIRVTGGFVSNERWAQMVADVLNRPLLVPENIEGTLVGTALLGHATVDESAPWTQRAKAVGTQHTIVPNPANHRLYTDHYRRFRSLYETLQPFFSPPGE